jgi:hypothetical protein
VQPDIRTAPLEYTIFGYGLRHDPAQTYGAELKLLLDRLWATLITAALPNDGLNQVVYDGDDTVFVGVRLTPGAESSPTAAAGTQNGAAHALCSLETHRPLPPDFRNRPRDDPGPRI